MPLNRLPQRSDRAINFGQYLQMAKDIERSDINFDPTIFNVISDGVGTFVSIDLSNLGGTSNRKQVWDLVETASNTVAITNYNLPAASILGSNKSIGYDHSKFHTSTIPNTSYNCWEASANSSSDYIYLELDRANLSATLKMDSSLPAGTDSLETKPLYYIEASNSNSNSYSISNIIDMRTHISLDGMS